MSRLSVVVDGSPTIVVPPPDIDVDVDVDVRAQVVDDVVVHPGQRRWIAAFVFLVGRGGGGWGDAKEEEPSRRE